MATHSQLADQFRDLVRSTRSEPVPVITRAAVLTPKTLDEENRRIQSVLTTEDPVAVYDWRRGEIVLEILRMDGAEYEEQTPLLRDHNQYSVTSILGSVIEPVVANDRLDGWLEFGTELDDTAESIWRRVKQGHLRRVSIGYDYTAKDYVTIPAGETQTVKGKSYTAPKDRSLRIVFRWRLREVSVVVIPADARAKLKSQGTADATTLEFFAEQSATPPATAGRTFETAEDTMKQFLRFLHGLGLASTVTDTDAALEWARGGVLTSAQLNELANYCKSDGVAFEVSSAKVKGSATTGTRSGEGSGGTGAGATGTDSTNPAPTDGGQRSDSLTAEQLQTHLRTASNEAIAAERARITAIRELAAQHPEVSETVVRAAENEGITVEAAQGRFLEAIRTGRQTGVPPAGHVRGSEQLNLRVLHAALLERAGIRPDSPFLTSDLARSVGGRREFQSDWICNQPATGQRRDALEQAFDIAGQRGLRNLTLMRLAELVIEQETGERVYDETQLIERAFASGGFTALYGSVVHMQLLNSYALAYSAYEQFVDIVDVMDHRDHKDADMTGVGRMVKQSKKNPGKAATLNVDDPTLQSVAAERYAGVLKLTDLAMINDSFGIAGHMPEELGKTAKQMVADIVWAEILRTDNLSDGKARYNSTDGNDIDVAAFDTDGVTAMGVALGAKKIGKRRIQVAGGVIAAGLTQSPAAKIQIGSETINHAVNPHRNAYRVVEDTAIDLGVDDPANDEAAIAGTPDSLYAFATGDKRSVKLAFRRGTNRGPITRRGILTEGEWGLYWDIFLDVGAAFQRRVGTVRVNVTG
ncbi:phage major capsid protein [Aureliella helgolandensis]|uniref:Caudovirus prohead protease n=1 Tax=Aureliella helgolandensis TaxID=2527968 RepID=A0A518G2U1_9BACT|nr:hypothetical protein [Aureliella helgolandensis]QDV22926.1 Caudovirus prohead protease [Aureliella helgolandensis]